MLKTVNAQIANLGNKTFQEYFMDYVMKIQDDNLAAELKFFELHNEINSVLQLDSCITKLHQEMFDNDRYTSPPTVI